MICGTQERSGLSLPSLPLLMGYCTCSSIEMLQGTGEQRYSQRRKYTLKRDDIKRETFRILLLSMVGISVNDIKGSILTGNGKCRAVGLGLCGRQLLLCLM